MAGAQPAPDQLVLALGLPDADAVAALPRDQLLAVLLRLAALQTAVGARLAAGDRHRQHDGDGRDHLLGIEDAAKRLAVTPDWLRRRGHLPFVVKLSDGVVRYSAAGITRFIAAQCQT
jgi:hypothetical protein